MDILQSILNLFIRYGYLFLFFATALENIPIVGVFLPGEMIVVAAGFFAASGEFDITTVIVIAFFGATVGTVCSYLLGFWGGRAFLERVAAKFGLDGDRLNGADRYFSTHGHITVFVGRYLSGIKALIPALAGVHHMRFSIFLAFAILGIATWTVLAACLGFYFGANWVFLMKIIKTAGWSLLAVAAVIIAFIWYRRRKKQ